MEEAAVGIILLCFSGACYVASRRYESTHIGIVIVAILCLVFGLVALALPLFRS